MTPRQKVHIAFLCHELKKPYPGDMLTKKQASCLIAEWSFFYNGSDEELAEKYTAWKDRFLLERDTGDMEADDLKEAVNEELNWRGRRGKLTRAQVYSVLCLVGGRDPGEGMLSLAARITDRIMATNQNEPGAGADA